MEVPETVYRSNGQALVQELAFVLDADIWQFLILSLSAKKKELSLCYLINQLMQKSSSNLIFSVKELMEQFLGVDEKFTIPSYQRGYKWNSDTIDRLIDDINGFDTKGNNDKFYCLQNLTLVQNESGYNVVDGQQRLTTLMVIGIALSCQELFKDRILYAVRSVTQGFILRFLFDKEGQMKILSSDSWEGFLESEDKESLDYQDIFYLYNAFKTVSRRISELDGNVNRFKDKYLNHVKIIVNNIKGVNEQKLFSNLNGGRVQLDGSDLIRALIITDVAKQEYSDLSDDLKRIVQLNECRVRIGLQIDTIMQWWNDENHYQYYSHVFKAIRSTEDILFEDRYPINGLYKLFSVIETRKKTITLSVFDGPENTSVLWEKIQKLQRTLVSWYNDSEIYHLLMYVLLYWSSQFESEEMSGKVKVDIQDTFVSLYNLWSTVSRKEFCKELRRRIRQIIDHMDQLFKENSVFDDAEEYRKACFSSDENWYKNENTPKLMILLDIIDILKRSLSNLPPELFRVCSEDKEHIIPQTPMGGKIDKKPLQEQNAVLNAYLEMINPSLPEDQRIPTVSLDHEWDPDTREAFKNNVNERVSSVIPINCLGNICLLREDINCGYGNEFYTEKRIEIISAQSNGKFIRPHVLDAFDKVWLRTNKSEVQFDALKGWSTEDIIARRRYIEKELKAFFPEVIYE